METAKYIHKTLSVVVLNVCGKIFKIIIFIEKVKEPKQK
jgi:hypothetical protein